MYKPVYIVLLCVASIKSSRVKIYSSHASNYAKIQSANANIVSFPVPSTNFIAGTFWDDPAQSLYTIDFISPVGRNSIYRYDYRTGQIYGAQVPGIISPSFIWSVEGCDDLFILGIDAAVVLIRWDGISPTGTLVRTIFTVPKGHMNYALADKKGRLYTGNINRTIFCSSPAVFETYRYDNGQLTTLLTNMITTTGLAIDYKRNIWYVGDACQYQILAFDYDCETGDICNGRVVYDFRNSGVTPFPLILGLNVDTDGMLWCTTYESGFLYIIDPIKGIVVRRLTIPSPGVSDIVFGGPNHDQIFVSATRVQVNSYGGGVRENRTADGTLFKLEGFNVRGYPTPRVRLDADCPRQCGASGCSKTSEDWNL